MKMRVTWAGLILGLTICISIETLPRPSKLPVVLSEKILEGPPQPTLSFADGSFQTLGHDTIVVVCFGNPLNEQAEKLQCNIATVLRRELISRNLLQCWLPVHRWQTEAFRLPTGYEPELIPLDYKDDLSAGKYVLQIMQRNSDGTELKMNDNGIVVPSKTSMSYATPRKLITVQDEVEPYFVRLDLEKAIPPLPPSFAVPNWVQPIGAFVATFFAAALLFRLAQQLLAALMQKLSHSRTAPASTS